MKITHVVYAGERVKPWFFATLNIIIRHIFPENFSEITQFVYQIRRFSPLILTNVIDFLDFLTLPCYKETHASILKMMSAIAYIQPTLNRLFNNCFE